MDNLKKNPVFAALILFCLLVFLGGVSLVFMAAGAAANSDKKLESAKRSYEASYKGAPAPSEKNVAASAENLAKLIAQLDRIRTDLERGANLELSDDGVEVMASIQQFISEAGSKLATHETINGLSGETEAAPIETGEGFAFGFDAYADAATIPVDPQMVSLLDKQRQILAVLVDKLIVAEPQSIELIEREGLEQKGTAFQIPGTFKIDPAISARVPNAINTLAFRVSFKGYTESLRLFLNELAKFDLPIVVRGVKVDRPAESDIVSVEPADNSNNFESIFGPYAMDESTEENTEAEAQKPVIVDNLSTFTLLLEFIEVVLPAETINDEGEDA
ncbi:MAG: Uncharacterised protein [Opitutia bacterium UBA7350]|nr:MAG: Uncharacterised protein [Opitutae bacterium UBA7350]